MAVGIAGSANDIGEKLFGTRIAVQDVILGAFFVIQHKLHRDTRLVWPLRVRRFSRVAAQIARI